MAVVIKVSWCLA